MTDFEKMNVIMGKNWDIREEDDYVREEWPNCILAEVEHAVLFVFEKSTGKFKYTTKFY